MIVYTTYYKIGHYSGEGAERYSISTLIKLKDFNNAQESNTDQGIINPFFRLRNLDNTMTKYSNNPKSNSIMRKINIQGKYYIPVHEHLIEFCLY